MERNQTSPAMILRLRLGVLLAAGFSLAVVHPPSTSKVFAAAGVAGIATRPGYAGDQSCEPCHQEQSHAYSQTAHHLTSQLPSAASILGSFEPGKNVVTIESPETSKTGSGLFFQMMNRDGNYYQAAFAERDGERLTHEERMDIVLGSGTRGQTYLSWSGNALFELPVSYWKEGGQWINSPGYQDGTAVFKRPVHPRCLECHSTFVQPLSRDPQTNLYERDSLVAGISCETCHGPGAAHVAAESQHAATRSKPANPAILNPTRFVRDRRVDQCALCHNGVERNEFAPSFSYLPGRDLNRYLAPNPADSTDRPDVHGNQAGLLKKSRCYLASASMSCSTCHNVHQPEQEAAAYSSRCLNCHSWQRCGLSLTLGSRIQQDCINCHMPLQQTAAIVSVTAGRVVRTSIRTHWIKVYPLKPIDAPSP